MFQTYGIDILSFTLSAMLLASYYLFLARKLRRYPTYTIQAINNIARKAWVESIMRDKGKEVLAVQTLRNSIMAATLPATSSVVLIIGVLTLSAQGDKMESTWHVLNFLGVTHSDLWLTKLLIMLLDLLVAFFSFSVSIRFYNHVGFMVNVPLSYQHETLQPEHVAVHLNRAGRFYSLGMRAYYFAVPLVFWLFGPHFMLMATIALVFALYRLDRAPRIIPDSGNDRPRAGA